MSKKIVNFLIGLDAIADFFKEKEEEEEEFSQHGESNDISMYVKAEKHHVIRTEDDSIVSERRGY